ncbi:Zinc-type alcohol dehydrogenase-like protein [Cyphellophora attinorum]|uniref:Zinc-type alcohol dehydrogenase-like protein n=1 Tax=Cyphellophora attinorum TaxID=1664694 RepID=A0A0N1GZT9_9EURO|nr:Zinc-type alcohol dehydrogenase-like protein [Phialophora attinorum]KPI36850.1 Zinc-type alcohol dehydrogenase-like protein [Phialophora attinorum]
MPVEILEKIFDEILPSRAMIEIGPSRRDSLGPSGLCLNWSQSQGWRVPELMLVSKSFREAVRLQHSTPIPALGPNDCLIRVQAVSLNYRDIATPLGLYPGAGKDGIVPTSDGAGTIVAVGDDVSEFQAGDRVCNTFFLDYQDGIPTAESRAGSLGVRNDGPLRQYAVFPTTALVSAPKHLNARQASTLPCAALTAWNALMGLGGCRLQAGQSILTQGTGGVSLFAIQFALALGATVIATTSSDTKADRLRALGVKHIINYRTDPNWGETARKLSPNGLGVQHVLEVGGEATMAQSFKAAALGGCIDIIGFLAKKDGEPSKVSFWDAFTGLNVVRGIGVGNRKQFGEMNKFMEEKGIAPIVDERVFGFGEAREAYEYLKKQEFFGKVVIDVAKE